MTVVNGMSLLLAVTVIAFAAAKWHILKDRRLILSTIGNALKERKSLRAGAVLGLSYLALFMILGGKGGRIHMLFGRLVWNTTLPEVLTGVALAALVTVSTALFVYGAHLNGLARSGEKGALGLLGSLMAVLASFCP